MFHLSFLVKCFLSLARNSWTAVSIDGSWCFINCNWGARHVKGDNNRDGTLRRQKCNGPRLDSNVHNHHNNVEILYDQHKSSQGLTGSSVVQEDAQDIQQYRQDASDILHGVTDGGNSIYGTSYPSYSSGGFGDNYNQGYILGGAIYSGGGAAAASRGYGGCVGVSGSAIGGVGVGIGGGVGGCSIFSHSRFRTGSLGSVSEFKQHCGLSGAGNQLQRVSSNSVLSQGGNGHLSHNGSGSSSNSAISHSSSNNSNNSHNSQSSNYASNNNSSNSSQGSKGYSNQCYAVPQGFTTCEESNAIISSVSHIKKLTRDHSIYNKENAGEPAIVECYSGKSLLDAFYNKDIKSKLTIARLSDDSTGYSSGCSKSSNERLSPPNSPLPSAGSSSASSGCSFPSFSCTGVKKVQQDDLSPPQIVPNCPNKSPRKGDSSKSSPPQSSFRNSSASDNSNSSGACSAYRGVADFSPSNSVLQAVEQSDDLLRNSERLSPPLSIFSSPSTYAERWRCSDGSGYSCYGGGRRDSISTVGDSVVGEDPGTDLYRQPLFYECDEFYFITDPEDHIYQHYPDDPAWQLLEVPITMEEFLDLPVVKSPFFNAGLKFATHYDCKQYTQKGEVSLQLKIPSLLTFGYTLVPRDKRLVHNQNTLEGRVLLRIIGHKAMFSVSPPKRGRYYFTVYVKDEKGSEFLQSACAFQITCRESRDAIKPPYPKVSFFGPTQCMSNYGLLPQTHIDPLVSYNHDDINFQFAASRTVRLSYSLTFHCQRADAIDVDLQRYAFLRQRDDTSMALQVRCPHVGKYVFSIYGAKSVNQDETDGQYECLFRYLIDCKQSATNKSSLPRACHRWCHSQLLEPVKGDLLTNTHVTFRVRAPLVSDMALLMGDAWFHFHHHPDHVWEACIITRSTPGTAKLYARLNRETARFSPFLEFQIVDEDQS